MKLRAPKGESVATWNDFEGQTDGLICLAGGADGPLAAALALTLTLSQGERERKFSISELSTVDYQLLTH